MYHLMALTSMKGVQAVDVLVIVGYGEKYTTGQRQRPPHKQANAAGVGKIGMSMLSAPRGIINAPIVVRRATLQPAAEYGGQGRHGNHTGSLNVVHKMGIGS